MSSSRYSCSISDSKSCFPDAVPQCSSMEAIGLLSHIECFLGTADKDSKIELEKSESGADTYPLECQKRGSLSACGCQKKDPPGTSQVQHC